MLASVAKLSGRSLIGFREGAETENPSAQPIPHPVSICSLALFPRFQPWS